MKILILDTVHGDLVEGLVELGFDVIEEYGLTKEEIESRLNGISGIVIRSRFPIDKQFIEKASDLKFIARVGAGMENIDQRSAALHQIELIKAPEGNRDAVGEHALGMLLMLLNNLSRADREIRNGEWHREENRGYEIQGKTIGIIGYGNMGSAFAVKLRGFGVEILAYDKYVSGFGDEFVHEVSLEQLKLRSDIVSIHTPLTDETKLMVNTEFFRSFSKKIYFINTARGRIVETTALVQAIQNGQVLGACLDVLEYEKKSFEGLFKEKLPEAFQFLINSDQVVLSPHIAGWSFESNGKMAHVILEKIRDLNLL